MSSSESVSESESSQFEDVENVQIGEEVVQHVEFRKRSIFRRILFSIGCILTVGILALVCHWFDKLFIKMTTKKCSPKDASRVVVIDEYGHCLSSRRMRYTYMGKNLNIFTFKNLYFSYDETGTKFTYVEFPTDQPYFYYETTLSKGVHIDKLEYERNVNGLNSIEVPVTPLYIIVLDQALHPFIIFQIFSIIVWSLYDYYYYAALIGVMTIFSVITEVVQTRSNMVKLHDMTKVKASFKVLRRSSDYPDGKWLKVDSKELVPGDVFLLKSGQTMTCDALLLGGAQAIMNETMLTGESVPIVKTGIPHIPVPEGVERNHDGSISPDKLAEVMPSVPKLDILDMNRDKGHILFSGTKVVRARGNTHEVIENDETKVVEDPPLCVVLRTGFATAKGQLVRSILYPKPTKFKFFEDSFKFIGVMALIAFVGFIVNAVIQTMYGEEIFYIILRAGDLVTIAVPPTLPAVMSAGASYALSRLQKRNIYCIDTQRVNMAGKIDVMCFDKTGTLTEDDLSVLGVKTTYTPATPTVITLDATTPKSEANEERKSNSPNSSSEDPTVPSNDSLVDGTVNNNAIIDLPTSSEKSSFSPLYTETSELSTENEIFLGMTCCHSVADVDGVYVGDPLDVKMFEFTKWNIIEKGQKAKVNKEGSSESSQPVDLMLKTIDDYGLNSPLAISYDAVVSSPDHSESSETNNENGESKEVELSPLSNEPKMSLGIVRRFDFTSALQRMSVISQRYKIVKSEDKEHPYVSEKAPYLDVYVKGSPEILKSLCHKKSIPANFEAELASFTHRGLRVIAFGHKTIAINSDSNSNPEEGVLSVEETIESINGLHREDVEKDLTFLGFFILENKLRPTTTPILNKLTNARIRSLMITGDNPLTAINIAREAFLIPSPPLYVPESAEEQSRQMHRASGSTSSQNDSQSVSCTPLDEYPVFLSELDDDGEIVWRCSEYPDWTLDPKTLEPVLLPSSVVSTPASLSISNDVPPAGANLTYPFSENCSIISSASALTSNTQQYSNPKSPSPSANSSIATSSTDATPNPGQSPNTSYLSLSVVNRPVASNPGISPAPSITTINTKATKSIVKENTINEKSDTLSVAKINPFEGWRGGPWGPLYWRGFDLPESFTSSTTEGPPPSCYFLAVSGPVFRKMYNEEHKLIAQLEQDKDNVEVMKSLENSTFKKICFLAPIFARMSPDDKAHLVETLISLGFITGMCGDGANDCGALKAAHVGISLSEVEASIAAPFTSKKATIECVEEVILEGRASLSSSFHAFKATANFSMIQFISSAILIGFDTMLTDFGFLLLDIFMTLPVLFTTGYARPSRKLEKDSPPSALVSFSVISSLIVNIIVTFIVQMLATVVIRHCSDFYPIDPDDDNYDHHLESYETTAVLLSSLISYVISGLVINLYDKFLEPLYKNWLLTGSIIFCAFCAIFTFVSHWDWYISLLQMKMTEDFSFYLYCILATVISFIVLTALEYGFCQNNLPKKIYRKIHPLSRYAPKVVKIKSDKKSEEGSSQSVKTRLVYKKDFYSLINEMNNYGKAVVV